MCKENQWTVGGSEERCKFTAVVLRRIADRLEHGNSPQKAFRNEAELLYPEVKREAREWTVAVQKDGTIIQIDPGCIYDVEKRTVREVL